MKSRLPKVLHKLAGKALLHHVVDTANTLRPESIFVVYGHGGELIVNQEFSVGVRLIEQKEQLGTGHAVAQVLPELEDDSVVLVLYGDVPLVRTDTLADLVRNAESGLSLLTVHLDNPKGYGRIIRDEHGSVVRIIEEKDASDDDRLISETNTGMLAVDAKHLKSFIGQLNNDNAQGEYYLTDLVEMASASKLDIVSSHPDSEMEVAGVNSREQLSELEGYYQMEQAIHLMDSGVTLRDPTRLDIRGSVSTGKDVDIDINVVLEGNVTLGDDVSIGPGCIIKDSTIAKGTTIHPYSVIENVQIGEYNEIGPFARLRPGSKLSDSAKIGNFVEIKNSEIGPGSKVNHLSYIGDTSMGAGVNIGAGTITANYDGANKHRTDIEDNASIGSNSVLVAPVKVRSKATLGAGTILRKDASSGELTMSPTKQVTIKGWKRPVKKS
jgi:bifunctional UDP-N-acetylglucosamine pyrophosphorylase/glucosamine-1-phosphate N-acetyltransferase